MSESHNELELLQNGCGWRHWKMEHLERATTSGSPSSSVVRNSVTTELPNRAACQADKVSKETKFVSDRALDASPERIERERIEAKAAGYKEGFEKARQQGFDSGLAAGRKAAEKEIEQARREILAPLRAMADEYGSAVATLSEETTAELVDLALAIAESVARCCIEEDRTLITRVVQSVVEEELAPSARPDLLLNPADIDALKEAFPEELDSGGWKLVADEKITRGGCLLRVESSEIDATWETRWRMIRSQLRSRGDETKGSAEQSDSAGNAENAA